MASRAPNSSELKSLEDINAKAKPLKEKFLKLRGEHLKLAKEQREVSKQLQQIGDEYARRREELLAQGVAV